MLKNSFFKLKTNRKYNYKPRYLKDKNEQINYSFDSRIRGSREITISNNRNSFWNQDFDLFGPLAKYGSIFYLGCEELFNKKVSDFSLHEISKVVGYKAFYYIEKGSGYISEGKWAAAHQVIKNQSTYWLVFELIWRDYFKYISMKYADGGYTWWTRTLWERTLKTKIDIIETGPTFK